MGNDSNRAPLLRQCADLAPQGVCGGTVQASRRFIEDQQRPAVAFGQKRQRQAAFLPLRQGEWVLFGDCRQPPPIENLRHRVRRRSQTRDLFAHRLSAEMRLGVLKGHRAARSCAAARVGLQEACQTRSQRRFSGTVRAKNGQHFTRPQHNRDVPQNDRAEGRGTGGIVERHQCRARINGGGQDQRAHSGCVPSGEARQYLWQRQA